MRAVSIDERQFSQSTIRSTRNSARARRVGGHATDLGGDTFPEAGAREAHRPGLALELRAQPYLTPFPPSIDASPVADTVIPPRFCPAATGSAGRRSPGARSTTASRSRSRARLLYVGEYPGQSSGGARKLDKPVLRATCADTRNAVRVTVRLCPTACPTDQDFQMVKPNQAGIIIRVSGGSSPSSGTAPRPRNSGAFGFLEPVCTSAIAARSRSLPRSRQHAVGLSAGAVS